LKLSKIQIVFLIQISDNPSSGQTDLPRKGLNSTPFSRKEDLEKLSHVVHLNTMESRNLYDKVKMLEKSLVFEVVGFGN